MTCHAQRQGDEWFCAICNLRWGNGDERPKSCAAVEEQRDGPASFPDILQRDDRQTIIAGALKVLEPKSNISINQRQIVCMAMHFASDPGTSDAVLKAAADQVCTQFPSLNLTRKT